MRFLFNLVVRALIIVVVLPAIGLITFHANIFSGLLASLILTVANVGTAVVLFPLLLPAALVGTIAGALTLGKLGIRAAYFALATAVSTVALWLTSLLSDVELRGFWLSVGAGAVLSVVTMLLPTRRSNNSIRG